MFVQPGGILSVTRPSSREADVAGVAPYILRVATLVTFVSAVRSGIYLDIDIVDIRIAEHAT